MSDGSAARKQGMMASTRFITRHPVLTYVALTFAISWGGFVDRTGSLLVATLMHGSLTASALFVFTPAATGASFLIYTWALAGAMWIVVAAVAFASSGHPFRRPILRRMA
jgi:hypothetical protein